MTAPNEAGLGARTIVVGVDSSLSARLALEHAAHRLAPGGRLIVAHVVNPQPAIVATSVLELMPERHTVARELVDRLAGDVAAEAEVVTVEGSPAERLAELAREREADEIVVGSRGLGRFSAALGSVSHALLEHADHPVVVVPRAAAERPHEVHEPGSCTVVVGFDGSEPARAAFAYAARRSCLGGRIVAVHAFQPAPDWLGWPNYQSVLDAHQEGGRKLLEALEDEMALGAQLETSLLEGPAARAIISAAHARDADEIVIGSRGFGPVRGVLGSVSHALLHEADRVVVVIPADAVGADQPA